MSRPIIDVGLKIDISEQMNILERQLDNLATHAGKGVSKKVSAEIDGLKKEILGLQSKLQNLGNSGGVSNNRFNKEVNALNKDIQDLQTRTYALEAGMSSLIKTLSKSDGDKLSSSLKEIEIQMESLRQNTLDTVKTITDFRELTSKSANVNLINQKTISSSNKELKQLQDSLSVIEKIKQEDFNEINLGTKSEDDLLKKFNDLHASIVRTRDELKKTDTNTETYSALRQELIKTAETFSKLYISLPIDISDDSLDNIEKLNSKVKNILADIELSISTRISQINSSLSELGTDNTTTKNNRLSIPLVPGTTSTALAKRVRLIIDETQGKINNYPLEVQFVLASGYSSKKTNTMLRQFQKEIDQIPDSVDKKNIQALFNNLSKDFKKELDIKVTASTLKDTEKSINASIERIKTLLKKNLTFNITPALNDESKKEIQSQLNNLSKILTLKIQNLDLSDIPTDSVLPKDDSIGKASNELNLLQQKINDIKGQLADYPSYFGQIKESLDKINTSFDSLKEFFNISNSPLTSELDAIIKRIEELSEVFKKAFNVLSTNDLNTMFAKLKEQTESFGNFNLTKNVDKKALEEIISLYREYLSLGGTNTINDLTSNQKAISKLVKEYEKQENVSNEVISTVNSENSSIEELKANIDNASASKENFAQKNSEVLNSITSSLQALEAEGNAFEKISEVLNKLGSEKSSAKLDKTIEGLRSIQSLLSEPISENSLLNSLISLANQGTNLEYLATVLKATKKQIETAQSTVKDNSMSSNLLGSKGQSIIANAEDYIQKTKNYGSVINTSLNEGKNGVIQITSLIKTLDGTYQQYVLSTVDGEHFREEQINKSTASIAKQIKTYAQVQQAFERMRATSNNQTFQSFFDIDNNPEVWEEMISLAKKYYSEIGNLKNIMRQTRQDSAGNLLESFVLKGDLGSVTVGREGETVASKQDLANITTVISKIKELSTAQKNYYLLKEKITAGTAISSEIEQLEKLDLKYTDIINDINKLSDSLKIDNIASDELSELMNSRVLQYNETLKKYYESADKLFSNKDITLANQNKSFSPALSQNIVEAKKNLEELYSLIDAHRDGSTIWSEDEIRRVAELRAQIDKTSTSLKDQSGIISSSTQIDKLLKKIYKDLNDNTNMSSELRNKFQALARIIEETRDNIDSITLKKFTDEFTALDSEIQRTGQTGKSFWHQMSNAIQSQNAQFIATYFSFQDIIRYIRTIVSTVTTLDSALTELRKVSDASTARLAQNFRTSAETAKELGATVSEVINMTADWARLGYSVDEAEELARVTTLFQNVGDDMSAETASEDMISTIQGFQLEVSQATEVVDKYNEVANNFAIDTYGIGEALKRSAASFNAANTDLSEAIALVTATNEVIQNPESVGTLWKTLSARIRGATTELEELGEETDEFTDSTSSKLRDLVKSLTGFDIMEDADTYKSVYEIILGIGQAWENLTDIEQASLGEALAGKRNSNALYAVLGNLDTLQEAYKTAEQSSGSAMKEQENYMRSIQYSLDVFAASWQELQADLLDSSLVKGVIDIATTIVQGIDSIAEATNGVVPILALASAGLGIFIKSATGVKNFTELARAITLSTVALNQNVAAQELETLSDEKDIAINQAQIAQEKILAEGLTEENIALAENTTLQGASSSATKASAGAIGLASIKTLGLVAAVIAATAAIYSCITANKKLADKTSELYTKFDASKSEIENYKTEISELQKTLADNNTTYEDAKTARERLLTIQEELISTYGSEANGISIVTDALNGQVDALDNLSRAQWNKTRAEINDNGSWFEWIGNKWNQLNHNASTNEEVILKEMEATARFIDIQQNKTNKEFLTALKNMGANIFEVENAGGGTDIRLMLNQDVEKATNELNKYLDIASRTEVSDNVVNGLQNQLNALDELSEQYGDFYNQYILYERILNSDSGLEDRYSKQLETYSKYKQAVIDGDQELSKQLETDLLEQYNSLQEELENDSTLSDSQKNSIVNAFLNAEPEIRSIVEGWRFKITFDAVVGNTGKTENEILSNVSSNYNNSTDVITALKAGDLPDLQALMDARELSENDILEILKEEYGLYSEIETVYSELVSRRASRHLGDDFSESDAQALHDAYLQLDDDTKNIISSMRGSDFDIYFDALKDSAGNANKALEVTAKYISDINKDVSSSTSFSEYLSGLTSLKDGLASLGTIYNDIADGGTFDFSQLTSDDFSEVFSSYSAEYNEFISAVSNSSGAVTSQVQNAFNKLVSAYIQGTGALDNVTTATRNATVAFLEQNGVTNAAAVVDEYLATQKAKLSDETVNLVNCIIDENGKLRENAQELLAEAGASEYAAKAAYQLALEKMFVNQNGIQTAADIDQVIALANAAGVGVTMLNKLAQAKSLSGKIDSISAQVESGNWGRAAELDALADSYSNLVDEINTTDWSSEFSLNASDFVVDYKNLGGAAEDAASGASEAADAAEEEADAMSELSSELDELQDAYSKLLSIQEEYNANGKISVDSAQELMQMDFRYLSMLQTEGGALKLNEQAFQSVTLAKLNEMKITMMRNALNTMQSITTEAQAEAYLAMCTGQANMATAEATALQAALQAQMQGTTGAIAEAYNVIYSGLQNAMSLLGEGFANVDLSTLSTSATDATSDVADTVEEEFEEVFDWLDRRMTVLQKKADLFAAKRANADKTYFSRDSGYNYYINRERSVYKQQKETAKEQVKAYEEEYKKAIEGLDADTIAAIEGNGKGLQTITDEGMADAINKAIEWKDKLDDAKISIEEIQTKINDLSLEKFTYLAEVLERKMKKLQRSIDFSEFNSDMAEAMGYSTTSGVYSKLSTQYDKLALKQQKELQRLEAKRTQMIKNGNLTENSSQDLEMQDQIYELQQSILDTQLKQVQAARDARDAEFERFKALQQIADSYEDELSSIRSLHNEDNAIDDDAKYTNSAYSMMLTDYYNYTSNLNQVSAYEKQLQELKSSYDQGIMGADEYQEKEQEIRSAMYESAEAAKDAKDAIVELAKERIEKEIDIIEDQIDAYNELIDAQKDALQSEKDLHDYQQSIAESTKEIAVIERQLAAIENDNSASAIAKRRKLEEELANARETLEEKQYEHSIDSAESALDAQASAYEEAKNVEIARLEEKLKDVDALFAEATDGLNNHMTEALQGMTSTLTDYGITMSEVIANAIISGVQSGTTGASSYISNVSDEQSDYTSSTDAAAAAIAETEKKSSYKQTQASTAGELKSMISQLVKSKVISRSLADKWELASKTAYSVNAINNLIANDKSSTAVDKINILINKVKDSLTGKTTAQKKKLKEFINALRNWKSNIKSSGYYYSGAHNLIADQLAWTQEYGDEAILSPTRNAILTPLKAGDSVLTAKQTDALYSFAKNPLDFLKNLNVNVNSSDVATPQGIILNIDNVLTVQGDVNNSNAKQIADIAQLAINKAFNDFSSKIRKS